MTCPEARKAMLVADPAELQGETETPLAAHIADCADCRRAAKMFAAGTAQLAVVSANRVAAHKRRVSRRTIGFALVPVAAAAVFAALLLTKSSRRAEQPSRVALVPLPVAHTVSLEVARGQQATVLKTADPKVTVIWLSSGEGK